MRRIILLAILLVLIGAGVAVWALAPRAVTVTEGKFPEELVYVRSSDDVVNAA